MVRYDKLLVKSSVKWDLLVHVLKLSLCAKLKVYFFAFSPNCQVDLLCLQISRNKTTNKSLSISHFCADIGYFSEVLAGCCLLWCSTFDSDFSRFAPPPFALGTAIPCCDMVIHILRTWFGFETKLCFNYVVHDCRKDARHLFH